MLQLSDIYSVHAYVYNVGAINLLDLQSKMSSLTKESADCYKRASKFQADIGLQFIQNLAPDVGSKVLDLGCGTGFLAVALSKCVGPEGKVTAVDPDEDRLVLAQQNYAAHNISFMVGDDKTFPKSQYDLVFANCVVHWIDDKFALFNRIYQNLKPGGKFAFTTGKGPVLAKGIMDKLLGAGVLDNLFPNTATFLSPAEYCTLATLVGFEVASTEVKEIPWTFKSVNTVIDYYFGLLQGDLDHASINPQSLEYCRDKYDKDLSNRVDSQDMLHVVLVKPLIN